MHETELKLSVHASFIVPRFDEEGSKFHLREGPILNLRATYYDTEDLRLARNGSTLRYRSGERDADGWTLKLPVEGASANVRDEIRFPGSPTSVPDDARDLVTAFARTAPLVAVARLRTRRRTWLVSDDTGSEVAELADDEVSILEGRRVVARFRELEIESKGLDEPGLRAIGDLLLEAGAMPAEPIPKAVRALGPRATAPPDVGVPDDPRPDGPAAVAVVAALATGVRRLLRNDPLTRLGSEEGLHQHRVAARRLRSDLRTFGPLLDPAWAVPLASELQWLGRLLGEVRDLDVLQVRLHHKAQGIEAGLEGLFGSLAQRHEAARMRMLEGLRSDRYRRLLDWLVDAATGPQMTDLSKEDAGKALPPLVAGTWKRLASNGRALKPADADSAFHRVRIDAKRVRYAAEAVAPALGSEQKAATKLADLVTVVQDVLGAHQDAMVGQEVFRAFAMKHPDSGHINLAMGRLIEREARESTQMRDRFFEVWEQLDKKKNRRWLGT